MLLLFFVYSIDNVFNRAAEPLFLIMMKSADRH